MILVETMRNEAHNLHVQSIVNGPVRRLQAVGKSQADHSDLQPETNKRYCLMCRLEFVGAVSHCPQDGTPLVVMSDPFIGSVVQDKYQVLRQVGRGAMGTVYAARELDTDAIIALKVLHRSLVSDLRAVKRFQAEASHTSQLSSPHTISTEDYGFTDDGRPFMVMDFVEGRGLNTILDDETIDLARGLKILIQIADGLAHAHDQGLVHRDVKPSNIMIVADEATGDDIVKIVDFGISKSVMDIEESITQTGQVVGSPLYMSPEQCLGDVLDHRTDIYSLGCLMYHLLTGTTMFHAETVVEMLQAQIGRMPRAMSAVKKDLPRDLDQIMYKAVAKDPAMRYQSMQEYATALRLCYMRLCNRPKVQVDTADISAA